jgi:hypothetical protein
MRMRRRAEPVERNRLWHWNKNCSLNAGSFLKTTRKKRRSQHSLGGKETGRGALA